MTNKITLMINSGICKCGCSWDDHHLGVMMNTPIINAILEWTKKNTHLLNIVNVPEGSYPLYVPQECERYGCNELGGMKYNEVEDSYEYHCDQYEDKDGPLVMLEY